MGAEKSYDLSSANWRPRRADGIISSLSLNGKAGEDQGPRSKTVRQTDREFSPVPPSCSIQAFARLDEAHPHPRGGLPRWHNGAFFFFFLLSLHLLPMQETLVTRV